jgi:sulfite reductase alpha subunit-like flavoprotein
MQDPKVSPFETLRARYFRHHSATKLYFGCRSAMKDHHYGAEWEAYARAGKITYRVAFSRDGPEGTRRTYVQDLLRLDKESVWELLGVRGGTLIISG